LIVLSHEYSWITYYNQEIKEDEDSKAMHFEDSNEEMGRDNPSSTGKVDKEIMDSKVHQDNTTHPMHLPGQITSQYLWTWEEIGHPLTMDCHEDEWQVWNECLTSYVSTADKKGIWHGSV
jgi:hypothetical protein